jgi:F0F1-type ATP synthase epsilon subunit
MNADRTFNCVIIAPSGKLLDCQTPSVIFPAHDGQRGVLFNHSPMFCKLGLGILEVRSAVPVPSTGSGPALSQARPEQGRGVEGLNGQQPRDIFLLIDGGFAVICLNLLKVTSYEVLFPQKGKKEFIEHIIAGIRKKLEDGHTDQQQRQHLNRKITLLTQLLEL